MTFGIDFVHHLIFWKLQISETTDWAEIKDSSS